MKTIFVTGSDTDVGKTTVAGGLLRMLEGYRQAAYWKPVQTGTLISDDRRDLMTLTQLPESRFLPSTYVFPDPVSPHLAAERWNKRIERAVLLEKFQAYAESVETLIIEGAGGLLVPLSDDTLLIDLLQEMKVPCLLVVEDKLGAINHGLLSLEALRRRALECVGFVLTKATGRWGNRQALERHSGAACLAEIAVHQDGRTLLAQIAGDADLRRLMGLPVVPL